MKVVISVVLFFAASVSAQTGTLDQSSPATNAFFHVEDAVIWQAQVMPGLSGQLEGVRLTFQSGDKGERCYVRIRLEAAPATIPPVFDEVITKTVNDVEIMYIDVTAAAAQVVAGQPFVIEVQGYGNDYFLAGGSHVTPPGLPLYPEPLYGNGEPMDDGGWRLAFDTFVLPPPPCYPDCDGDLKLSLSDFGCFQTKFALGCP